MPGLFKEIKERLVRVQCGPLRSSPHNVTGIALPDLTSSLVSVLGECSRLVAGLGLAHHHDPPVSESELNEVLLVGVSKAVGSAPSIELCGIKPALAEEWPEYPGEETEEETMLRVGRTASPCITGSREPRGRIRLGASNPKPPDPPEGAGKLRLRKRRPPPEWCATHPPVSTPTMLTKLETLLAPRPFVSLPRLSLPRPEPLRWR